VQEDVRFPALVSRLLAEQGLKVNTLNAARSGNTLHDSLNVLLNHVVYDRPNIVVLMHASNDTGVLARDGDYWSRTGSPVASKDLGKWFVQMASSDLYVAALVRHSATSSIFRPQDQGGDWRHDSSLINKIPVDLYRQRLKAFVHICRDFGIQPVLMTEPFSGSTNSLTPDWIDRTAQDRFNTIIRAVGEEEGIPVIDLVRHLQERVPEWNKPMEIFYDAIHVTDKGSQIYAKHIAERLLPLILVRESLEGGLGSPSGKSQGSDS
jgi:lysophospholipase L1-like esterase